jgi:molecular chaperone HtpG
MIFKSANGDYITIKEYLERNKSGKTPQKIYYAPGEDTQVSFLNMMKAQGIEVIFANPIIDSHIFQHLEMKNPEVTFVRIDSEINESLVDKERKEIADASNQTDSEKLKEIFDKILNENVEASFSKDSYGKFIKKYPQAVNILAPYLRTKDDFTYVKPYEITPEAREKLGKDAFEEILNNMYLTVKTEVKHLKAKDIPAMIVFNEFMRRFQEMNYLSQSKDNDMLKNHTIVVNPQNETIKKILKFYREGKTEKAEL